MLNICKQSIELFKASVSQAQRKWPYVILYNKENFNNVKPSSSLSSVPLRVTCVLLLLHDLSSSSPLSGPFLVFCILQLLKDTDLKIGH